MDKKLLDILACPLCKGPLVYKDDNNELIAHWHDLRRTYATLAESIGVGGYTLKRLLLLFRHAMHQRAYRANHCVKLPVKR